MNSSIGRRNQFVGSLFESFLDGQHVEAGSLGILAHVVHNEAHAKTIRGRLIYTAPGVADYTGCLHGHGQVLAAEAKSTSKDRLMRAAIEPKQAAHLDAVECAGGLAFLLVEFRHDDGARAVLSRYAVPWIKVPWQRLKLVDSLAESAIQHWLIAPGTCYLSRYHPGSAERYTVGAARKRVFPRE